jgi:hypothetical protein
MVFYITRSLDLVIYVFLAHVAAVSPQQYSPHYGFNKERSMQVSYRDSPRNRPTSYLEQVFQRIHVRYL